MTRGREKRRLTREEILCGVVGSDPSEEEARERACGVRDECCRDRSVEED